MIRKSVGPGKQCPADEAQGHDPGRPRDWAHAHQGGAFEERKGAQAGGRVGSM